MYRIGIIDDAESERDDIQVSVLDNANGIELEFKEYELEARARKEILDEIRKDIEEENIHALIVDFKLDTTADVIEGWEIIEFMHDEMIYVDRVQSNLISRRNIKNICRKIFMAGAVTVICLKNW